MEELCRLPLDQLHGMGLFFVRRHGHFPAEQKGSGGEVRDHADFTEFHRTQTVMVEEDAQRVVSSNGGREIFGPVWAWDLKEKTALTGIFLINLVFRTRNGRGGSDSSRTSSRNAARAKRITSLTVPAIFKEKLT